MSDYSRYMDEFFGSRGYYPHGEKAWEEFAVWLSGKCAGYEVMLQRTARKADVTQPAPPPQEEKESEEK